MPTCALDARTQSYQLPHARVALQAEKKQPHCEATDPRILDCLATYLTRHCPLEARAFHLTCRNAATAIKHALETLKLVTKHVDLADVTYNFPAVAVLHLHQCRVESEVRCDLRSCRRCCPFALSRVATATLQLLSCVESNSAAGSLFIINKSLSNLYCGASG